jgi:CRP-like cAMP-binding protein
MPTILSNAFIAALPTSDQDALQQYLKDVELSNSMILFSAGDEIERVYFPYSGIVSIVVVLTDGDVVEAGMLGNNSLIGGSAALDGPVAINQAIIQSPGYGSYIDRRTIRRLARDSETLRSHIARHQQMMIVHTQQVAACNTKHGLEERLCRWLLQARDLLGSDNLKITQEFLSQMLGVTRSSVTLIAGRLQTAGLIAYRRGHIQVLDVERMKDACCECYNTINDKFDALTGQKPERW